MPTQGGKHTPGKENTVKWKKKTVIGAAQREREEDFLVDIQLILICVSGLVYSAWFVVIWYLDMHVIQSGKSGY